MRSYSEFLESKPAATPPSLVTLYVEAPAAERGHYRRLERDITLHGITFFRPERLAESPYQTWDKDVWKVRTLSRALAWEDGSWRPAGDEDIPLLDIELVAEA